MQRTHPVAGRLEKARADDEVAVATANVRSELANLRGIVLAVGVHLYDERRIALERVLVAGLERRPVAEVERVAQHGGARARRNVPRPIPGAVVHDDHLAARLRLRDAFEHFADRAGLVVGRDDQHRLLARSIALAHPDNRQATVR